jgi:hypothetical protein
MRKISLTVVVLICVSFMSFNSGQQSTAALRSCTGKEVAQAYSYRAQISGISAKLQNLYSSCETDGFKAGSPGPKAPQCTRADTDLLINFRTAYSQQVDLEASNSRDIDTFSKAYQRYVSSGQSSLAQQASLKVQKLTQEIQHHYLMQTFYEAGFNALATTCKNSGVSLPKRTLGSEEVNLTPTLANLTQRFMGYRIGDSQPRSILGSECGVNANSELTIRYLDSSRTWQSAMTPWLGKYDLASKYAVQIEIIPINPIYVNLSSGEWEGVNWPYETQNTFTVERCNTKSQTSNWVRQPIANMESFSYDGSGSHYRLDELGQQDLTQPKWACSIKKPVITTVKKNGKSVKVTKPASSDFKVNASGDGSSITIWECDDLKTGKFIETQKIMLENAWDLSIKDSNNNPLWVIAKSDPKYPNWTWACPPSKENRTCYPISGLS